MFTQRSSRKAGGNQQIYSWRKESIMKLNFFLFFLRSNKNSRTFAPTSCLSHLHSWRQAMIFWISQCTWIHINDLEISAGILGSRHISVDFQSLPPSSPCSSGCAICLNSSLVVIFDLLEMYGLQLKRGKGKKSVNFHSCWAVQNLGDGTTDLKIITFPGHTQSVP